MPTPEQVRRISYIGRLYGLRLPVLPVCKGHQSPAYMVAQLVYDRPPQSLWRGSRGSGKSMGSGLANYLLGQWYPEFEAKILGGSQAQSEQIYRAMDLFRKNRPEADAIREMLKTEAWFRTGAHVEMLTASEKSVRGPHIPQLCLDEVDEIPDDIREHAYGMVMRKGDLPASISMTSTWHKVAGPMARLFEQGEEGAFPVHTFCMFDVLERCPEERSGPNLEGCPACPLMEWCHADRDENGGVPKAKRSSGHYSIDAFIQKTLLSRRVFECDYLCLEPRAEGAWFSDFSEGRHVGEDAEYNRGLDFHVAVDGGVHCAAVWLQCRRSIDGRTVQVNVFGDYYEEHLEAGASGHAAAIMEKTQELTGLPTTAGTVSMDPAGRQSTGVGRTVIGEFKRMGCLGRNLTIRDWVHIGQGYPKADSLALLEALLLSADGTVSIRIHPRCKYLITALKTYLRAQSPDGQFLDKPKDPQHPAEDAVDALCGGLGVEMPRGRTPEAPLKGIPSRRIA